MSLPIVKTRVAKHLVGDNRWFGHSVMKELLGNETLTGLNAMAVTGRRPTAVERTLLEDLAVLLTSADTRIWPLKITRLVASYGGTMAGIAASALPLETKQIGAWVVGPAAEMLLALKAWLATHGDTDEAIDAFLATTSKLHGFGVPLRTSDERLDALVGRMAAVGRDRLEHWVLHERLADRVRALKGVPPNITLGAAAMLLDLGYEPDQASMITSTQIQNMFAANAFEAAHNGEAILRTLPDECIDYVGKPARTSPRARAAGQNASVIDRPEA